MRGGSGWSRPFIRRQEFNEKLDLVDWGMKIQSFDEVPQPRRGVEERSDVRIALPALSLAEFHFRRDVILGFLAEQASLIRAAGAQQWIFTDWNPVWTAIADDPKAQAFMSIAGLNYYQASSDKPPSWNDAPWHLDMHRSCYGKGRIYRHRNTLRGDWRKRNVGTRPEPGAVPHVGPATGGVWRGRPDVLVG